MPARTSPDRMLPKQDTSAGHERTENARQMIAEGQERKRLIAVTDGNIRNGHITVTGLKGFLPKDCFGAPTKGVSHAAKPIRIQLEGMSRIVETDIGSEARTGKPRRQFRARGWVKGFFQHHGVRCGDVLELERVESRTYRLRVVPPPPIAIRVAEFFAGIGLVRLAMERQGLKVVFANDIDPDKLEIYKANFPSEDFELGDIHDLQARDIPDCEVVTASFPCTDLSIAGAMNGIHSGESSAFWGLVKLLRALNDRRPAIVLLENVPGFLMSNGGRDFESALRALNELGYSVDAFFLDAARFVPQSRLRLFVVAKLGASGQTTFGLEYSQTRPKVLTDFILAHPHLVWGVRLLPKLPERTVELSSIIERLPKDHPAWWNEARSTYFMNQLSERHAMVAQRMIASKKISYATAFRRVRNGRSMAELRSDGLAGCLRTPKGGSGRQILFQAGKGRYKVRLLTSRECARLQGVPDNYRIEVPLNQALFGFGDAVCVPAVEWIVKNYLTPAMTTTAQSQLVRLT